MIPKTLNYIWFGGKPIPREVKRCISSWKKYCPDYSIVKWDENNFDINSHPFCKAAYENKAWAFASDYARLKIIYDNGGVYLDTDVELLRNIDCLLDCQCWLGVGQQDHLCATGLGFGAVKGSRIIARMLAEYDEVEFDADNLSGIACPFLNERALRSFGYQFSNEVTKIEEATIYPSRFFDPIAPGDTSEYLLCSESFSVHHYSNSWGSRSDVLRRKLIRLIGADAIRKLKRMVHIDNTGN